MISSLSKRARILWIAVPSVLLLLCLFGMYFFNHEPPPFNPISRATVHAQAHGHQVVTGYTTTATLIETVNVLLKKRGGYLSNDVLPPWVLHDLLQSQALGETRNVSTGDRPNATVVGCEQEVGRRDQTDKVARIVDHRDVVGGANQRVPVVVQYVANPSVGHEHQHVR